MPVVQIPDEYQVFEIDGDVIAGPVSTRIDSQSKRRPRWFEGTLYRKADGTGYVIHQVNYSLVWHLETAVSGDRPHVRKPEEISSADLEPGAVYCGDLDLREGREQCRRLPRNRRQVPARVITERPQHRVVACLDAAEVIRQLTVERGRGGRSVSVALSEPMRELLVEAEKNDSAFASARPVVRM